MEHGYISLSIAIVDKKKTLAHQGLHLLITLSLRVASLRRSWIVQQCRHSVTARIPGWTAIWKLMTPGKTQDACLLQKYW